MRPSRRCPKCDAKIETRKAPCFDGLDYCSADCAIDAYLIAKLAEEAHPMTCTCCGSGWVWGYELPDGEEPATDTRYPCPYGE